MRTRLSFLLPMMLLFAWQSRAQSIPRTFGAGALQLDDLFGTMNTLTFSINGPLDGSYWLKFPNYPPTAPLSYIVVDASGNIDWTTSITLPSLSPGAIWYGNASSVATELAPGPVGSILTVNGSSMPSWSLSIPGPVTISASQITSGTIQPGVTIDVGPGGIIQPAGGTINANTLSGAGLGKFTGKVPIPTSSNHLDVSYPGIQALAAITVSVYDPNAMTFGFVSAQVSQITPGVGFRVLFSADYPPSGTGELHYLVVNP